MSGLRCRVGDLAIVVRSSKPENTWGIGRIVQVIEPASIAYAEGPAWRVSPHLVGPRGIAYANVLDTCLRPIRPGADEPATETTREKEAA